MTVQFVTSPEARPTFFVPATDKQVAFIIKLAAERDQHISPADLAGFSKKVASEAIEALLGTPRVRTPRTVAAPPVELEAGMYTEGDTIFKVYEGQSGRMLAKRLVRSTDGTDWSFEYAGLASRFVPSQNRMSLEAAKRFGAIYGVCCQCGRTLTDEDSIAAGIGPVCASKF